MYLYYIYCNYSLICDSMVNLNGDSDGGVAVLMQFTWHTLCAQRLTSNMRCISRQRVKRNIYCVSTLSFIVFHLCADGIFTVLFLFLFLSFLFLQYTRVSVRHAEREETHIEHVSRTEHAKPPHRLECEHAELPALSSNIAFYAVCAVYTEKLS